MTTRARRTWHYRLINEDTARVHDFGRRVVKREALSYLARLHNQLIVEMWGR